MIVPLLAAAIALAAPSPGAARTPAGVDHARGLHSTRARGGDDCRVFVFAGIAGACNTDAQGTSERCCAALGTAEDARCFCDEGVVRAVRDVIGERGLDFFRSFASARCGARADGRERVRERRVAVARGEGGEHPPAAAAAAAAAGGLSPFPPAPAFPRAKTRPRASARGAPGNFPPSPASEQFIVDLPPLPSFPELPDAPATPLAPLTPPPPAPKPPPPIGTPGAAPQLDPAPSAADHRAVRGRAAVLSDPVRRKPPGLPTVWDKLNDDVADFQFGFFADAIVAVGLKGLFQSAGPFTVFAPTNRAWYSALVSLGVTKEASVS